MLHGFGDTGGRVPHRHPDIDGVTFTGDVGDRCRSSLKPSPRRSKASSFELGGKNAASSSPTPNLDRRSTGWAGRCFLNTGQVCLRTERVYVHGIDLRRRRRGAARRAPASTCARLPGRRLDHVRPAGLGRLTATRCCPTTSCAEAEGAKVLARRRRPRRSAMGVDGGSWVEPTLVDRARPRQPRGREEIFGPAAAPGSRSAPRTKPSGSPTTPSTAWLRPSSRTDVSRVHRVAPQLEAGIVSVNSWFLRDLRTAFGGMKHSGIGREGGVHGLEFYTELTNVCIKI